MFLASECMFFSGLFATYFTLREITPGEWPPHDVHLPVVRAAIFTTLLVLSSGTMQMAVRAIAREDKVAFRRWVIATAVLGLAFLTNQAFEWSEAEFSVSSHPFGSLFFTMTGFHGAHVSGGIIAMAVLLGRSGARRFSGHRDLPSVEVVSYYWHFVDVVWVIMFAVLFFAR